MLLNLQDVEIAYGRIKVLWGISLCVGEGEIVSLVGANGAGKSTLIKGIMGIVPLRKGCINFLGHDISKNIHGREQNGHRLYPRGGRVFPDLTVEDNLKLIASLCKNELNVRKRLDMIYSLFPS